jgi:hypothetical protein
MSETTPEIIAHLREIRDQWRALLREPLSGGLAFFAREQLHEVEANLKELGAED